MIEDASRPITRGLLDESGNGTNTKYELVAFLPKNRNVLMGVEENGKQSAS